MVIHDYRDGEEEATRMLGRTGRLAGAAGESEVSLTPRSEKVIQMACLEARQLDHDRVDTEHLLLGSLGESEGGAARVLTDLGVGYDEVRRRVLQTHAATDE